jgi:hypothetical protein
MKEPPNLHIQGHLPLTIILTYKLWFYLVSPISAENLIISSVVPSRYSPRAER